MRNLRQHLPVLVGFVLVGLVVAYKYLPLGDHGEDSLRTDTRWHNDWLDAPEVDLSTLVPEPTVYDVSLDAELAARTALDIRDLSPELAARLDAQEFRVVADQLLQMAARAVEEGDRPRLAGVLSLLGQLAIEEQDFDSAEVYLAESLDVYEEQDDTVGSAQVYMQLGRLHLKSRQRARTAGQAYDRLLIARWQISNGQHATAEQNLKLVIDENLSINRFGAAASAYNSLVRVHQESGDVYQAQQSAMEAARLYAASGQIRNARGALAALRNAGVERWRLFEIEQAIETSYVEFNESVGQIQQARDYRRLYHYYRSQGDTERAWKLRLLASKSLRNVSKRAMYHRIPDALALLYVSNDSRIQAQDYFDLARRTFSSEGLDDLATQTDQLRAQIY